MQSFSHLMYDPFAIDTVSKLESIEEFQFKFSEKDKAIAFLILVWDYNNRDWQRQFSRYIDLKREAAIIAGFKLSKEGKFSSQVEDLIIGNNPDFNRAVIRYLYLTGVPELPALAAHRELQSAELEAVYNHKDAKDRKQIRENIDKGTERIKEYEQAIFGGTEVLSLRTELYKTMESTKLRLRPEYIAEDTRSKKLQIKDIYYGD
jgi:hypothetical protein